MPIGNATDTITITSRASVGFFALMDHEVCANQWLTNIALHEETMRMCLLFNVMSRVEETSANSKGRFRDMDVVVLSSPLLKESSAFANDAVKQIRCLKKQSQKLQQAQDLLLPWLMNGEITV